MCLKKCYIDSLKLAHLINEKKAIFYKVVKKVGDNFVSPFYEDFVWKEGQNDSNFQEEEDIKSFWENSYYNDVNHGIHVFVDKHDAEKFLQHYTLYYGIKDFFRIIKVTGYLVDVIAVGVTFGTGILDNQHSAVFTKVYVPKGELSCV